MKEKKQTKGLNAPAIHTMLLIMIISLNIPSVSAENDEKYGIIVTAHGSPSESWCSPVRNATDEVDLPYPVELGFLDLTCDNLLSNKLVVLGKKTLLL